MIRSAVAFGAQGVIVPERRSAGVTAAAWRTSAGTAARLPVAQVTNLVRALKDCQEAGHVRGRPGRRRRRRRSTISTLATEPLVVVVGSEGRGLSRLVGETCDLTVSIPMAGAAESLNASVAAAVTLAEIARRRRAHWCLTEALARDAPQRSMIAAMAKGATWPKHAWTTQGGDRRRLRGVPDRCADSSLRHPIRTFNDLGGRRGMAHMLKYLTEHPEKGLLGTRWGCRRSSSTGVRTTISRRSRTTRTTRTAVAWRNYWKRVGKDNRTGIWHETYLVRAGEYEAMYANMPAARARQGRAPGPRCRIYRALPDQGSGALAARAGHGQRVHARCGRPCRSRCAAAASR